MTQQEVLQVLRTFQRTRCDEFGIQRIGVFGSTARGEMTDDSDVDVVVVLAKPDLLTLVGIKQELEGLLEQQVDIVRYRDRMNAFLKQRIEQEAIYV
jgi:predicted nucleotidyltransferase